MLLDRVCDTVIKSQEEFSPVLVLLSITTTSLSIHWLISQPHPSSLAPNTTTQHHLSMLSPNLVSQKKSSSYFDLIVLCYPFFSV
jgi:hypothetical protein